MSQRTDGVIRIGQWTVHPSLNTLERGETTVRVEPRAMDLLVFLAGRPGQVFSVDQLIAAVWNGAVVTDSSVYFAIRQLRQAFDGSDEAHCIETIPRRGYRLKLVAPEVVPPTPVVVHPRRWRPYALLAAVLGAVLIFALVNGTSRHASTYAAVLPFEDLSPDSDQAYLAEGIAEEIRSALGRVRGLHIAGSISSSRFGGAAPDLRTAGDALRVDFVLQGSVQRSGDQLRVAARLTEVGSGEQIWSESYDGRLADVFSLQDRIAQSVANAFEVRTGLGDIGRTPGMTRNVEAYDEYARGMYLNRQWSAESFPAAIAHLRRAVALDPGFSTGWADLAIVYANAAMVVPDRAAHWQRESVEALRQARAISPDSPQVLLAMGVSEVRHGNWVRAGSVYARLQSAYERHGLADQGWGPRGVLLLAVGRVHEAIRALERARAHEPLAPAFASFLARANLAAGNIEAAFAEVDRGLDLEGLGPLLRGEALIIALARRDRETIARRMQAIPVDEPGASLHRSLAAFMDNPVEAAVHIRNLADQATAPEKEILAHWAAYYHEPDLALQILKEASVATRASSILWTPLMRDVRRLPEFSRFVEASGFADYWRRHAWADYCSPARSGEIHCE